VRLAAIMFALLLWQGAVLGDGARAASTNENSQAEFDEFEDEFAEEFDVSDEPPPRNPLGGYNRLMFNVNDRIYFWILKPAGKAYGKIVPEQVRLSIHRCSKNLLFPARLVNNALQGKFKKAGIETARFGINSTMGILGLFDPAVSCFDLEPSDEDFGQTLGRYGVGAGFPLVLPLLGQANLRDAIGIIPDIFLNPLHYIEPLELAVGIRVYEQENYISLHIGEYEALKGAALDPYTLIRDAYRQKREAEIKD